MVNKRGFQVAHKFKRHSEVKLSAIDVEQSLRCHIDFQLQLVILIRKS